MSPSRGTPAPIPTPSAETTSTTTDVKADIRSSSALSSAKTNLHYLFSPGNSANIPAHRRTRALLRSLRYIGIFVFWRIVRYAKYALVGSIVAAVGATAFGGVVSGAAFFLAPPTLAGSLGIGLIWAVGKWGFRKSGMGRRVEEGAVREVQGQQQKVKKDGTWRDVQGPQAVPW